MSPRLIALVLFTTVFASGAELLDFDLSQQGPFVRQVRGWESVKSEGNFGMYKWAFGAWDANCLFELTLGEEADGNKHLAIANLSGTPAAMLFRPAVTTAQAGESYTCSFEYRTLGGGEGLFVMKNGETATQKMELALSSQVAWTARNVVFAASATGDLQVDWRPLGSGAEKALHLRKLSVVKNP